MATYFTSDLHFGHRNILQYCDRPWWHSRRDPPTDADVQAMNRGLTQNWNGIVKPEDTVYVLGDFAMGNKTLWPEYRKTLNGRIVLVRGNHDRDAAYMIEKVGIDEVHEELIVVDAPWCPETTVHMQHYPLGGYDGATPEEFGPYDYRLCGHVHSSWRTRGSEINVGVDVWHWKPRTFEELIKGVPRGVAPTVEWKPDRHGSKA